VVGNAQQRSSTARLDSSAWQSVGVGSWAEQEEEITGRRDKNRSGPGFLLTREEFQDFRLTLLFWISAGGSSSILLREPRRKWGPAGDDQPGAGANRGYEIAINYHDSENPTGAIWNIQKPKKLAGGEGQWNELEIICRGPELRVTIAGQKINRFDQLRVQPGVIGFKIPETAPDDMVVRFQDVVISSAP